MSKSPKQIRKEYEQNREKIRKAIKSLEYWLKASGGEFPGGKPNILTSIKELQSLYKEIFPKSKPLNPKSKKSFTGALHQLNKAYDTNRLPTKSLKTTSPTNDSFTTNIDPRTLEKLEKDSLRASLAANQAKRVLGKRLSKIAFEHIRGLSYNIVVNNPDISPEKLSSLLVDQIRSSTTLLAQNPRVASELKNEIKENDSPQKEKVESPPQKEQPSVLNQIKHIAQLNNPNLSLEEMDKTIKEIVTAVEATATTVNPASFSSEEIKTHISSVLKTPPPKETVEATSSNRTTHNKTPISVKVLASIPKEHIKALHAEKHAQASESLSNTPNSLPTYTKSIRSSSMVFRSIIQKGSFNSFLSDYKRSYRSIYSQRPSTPIRSPGSLLNRIWSQLSGKSGVRSNHSQVVLKTIRHFSPSSVGGGSRSFSSPLRSLLSKGLSSPLKNFSSATKRGLGGLLKKGGGALWSGTKNLAATAGKSLVSFLSKLTLSNPYVLGFVVLIFVIIGLIIWIDNYNSFTTQVAHTIPSGQSGGPQQLPVGGNVVVCSNESDITNQLSSSIVGGVVNLLPNGIGGRDGGLCVVPGKMIIHWSGGLNTSEYLVDGSLRTYETLISSNLSCQLASDSEEVWFMQPFYEGEVEMAWCANSWNADGISIEMSGADFTDNPPPPNLNVLELSYGAVCGVNEQYGLRWCDIYGHYQVPDSGGKEDPGREFLQNEFIPEIMSRCPNDPENSCTKNQVDTLPQS